jgi:predicted PurR-regulated permease PerM
MQNRIELIQSLIFVALLYFAFIILKPFLASIVIALVFAIVLYPVCEKLKRSGRLNSGAAAFLTLLFTFFVIIIPIVSLLGLIGKEAIDFVQNFRVEDMQEFFAKYDGTTIINYEINFDLAQEKILSTLESVSVNISNTAFAIVGSIFSSIYKFFVFLLLYFYFLRDKELLIKGLEKVLPYSTKQSKVLMKKFYNIAKTVFFATMLASLISGLFASIGFYLFGLGSPIIWGLLVALLSLIPTIGSLFVYLLGIFVVYFLSGWEGALGLTAFYVIFDLVLNENIIKARLLDDKLALHPILVFFAIVGGINTFGAMGILYGPIVLIFLGTIYEFKQSASS